jgi:hypothetical protein
MHEKKLGYKVYLTFGECVYIMDTSCTKSVAAVNYKFDLSTTRWCSIVLFQKSMISDGPSLDLLSPFSDW